MESLPLELLNTLVVFAQSRNSEEAARKLGLTQPAVTQHLQRLQAAMPSALFQMSGRKKVLTPFGEAVFLRAKEHIGALSREIEQVSLLYTRPEKTTIRIGGRREILLRLLPKIDFPGRIQAVNLNAADVITALRDRRIDAGITHLLPNVPDVIARPLFTDSARIAAHRDLIPKAKADVLLQASFLTSHPALFYRTEPPFMTEWLKHKGVERDSLEVKFVCDDWITLISLISKGKGWSIIPSSFTTDREIVTADLPEDIVPSTRFYLVYSPVIRSAPGFQAFQKSL